MAVARAPVGGGMTGTKVALIVFVCLTVASLAFAVILFTHQSDLEASTKSAQESAQKANADKSKMTQDAGEIFRLATGSTPTGDAGAEVIKESLQKAVKTLATEEATKADQVDKQLAEQAATAGAGGATPLKTARVDQAATLGTALKSIQSAYHSNLDLLVALIKERDALTKERDDLAKASEQRAKDFEAKSNDFQTRIAALEKANTDNQTAWSQQVAELKQQLEKSTGRAGAQLAEERKMRADLEKNMEQTRGHATELAEKLAKFQPGTDTVSAEQIADGSIVRAVPVDNIAYISLGQRDRIAPGMPFTVYSKPRPGTAIHEKGTVEVRNVYDGTSEVRVTSSKTGDPIMEGDVVANLVYDRNRQYRFVVAGDFDLDFDGRIDQPGGVQGQDVVHMIERWGGQVVTTLDTSVDFVVLGAPPPQPIKLPAGATDEAKQRAADQDAARKKFDAIRAEAKSLSIPVLTRTQFLHFIGIQVPPKTPEDQLAVQ